MPQTGGEHDPDEVVSVQTLDDVCKVSTNIAAQVLRTLGCTWNQLAGILNGAMPLWAAILAHLALVEERVDRIGAIGLVIGFIGLGVVIGPGIFDLAEVTRTPVMVENDLAIELP